MKKNVCEHCGQGWDKHEISASGGNLLWLCPPLENE